MEVPTITIGERLSSYLNGDDAQKSDVELAKEAQYLADQRWKMGQLMLQDGDKFKSDEYLRGEAMAIGQALVGKVGGEDAYGVMWSPDQRGYRTGREFKDAMVKLWKEPESFVSKDWEEFSKLDRAGKLAKAMEDVSATKRAMHAVGNVLEDMVAEGVGTGANAGSGSVWAGGAGDASRVKPVSDEAKAARQTAWEDRIIRDHEAKLRKKNAWMDLMAISANMKGDAKTCLDALLESPDNALPERLYGTFNALSDDDKEIVCHARELMKPTWDGSDAGTVVHDATVGLLNIAAKLKKAPFEQAKKLTAIAANEWFDAGIDVNAIAKRRQYLWDVTGGLSEKNSDMMEFEQRCEDHGVIGDALIGAVSTLPYMAVAAVPYAGPALVAAEAMQEMDEHVVREGGDITDPKYLVSSAVLGGLYAYIERLQVGKLLGEVGDLELRGAMVKGLWQAWRDKPALMAWNLTEKTLSESVQEGLQNGIMGVNEALALGKSVPAAFGEGFVEDFVGSLGTMFVVGAGGHVLGHAARSGWKAGAEGQSIRAGSYAEAVRDAARTAGVFELGEASAANRTVEIAASLDKLYGAWQRGGRKVLEGRGLSSDTIDQIEDYYRQAERLTDGMTPSADEKFKVATAIAGDISANIAEENRRLREDPERVGRAEGWLGCGNGLADMRRTWARGNALTQYKTDEDGKVVTDENGKPVIEADLGAKELEEDGYAPEVAKALSELLRQEHREFYSKGAVDAMRHAYETATDRQTAAAERLAASLKGGEVVRRDGLTFVRFDMEAGKDADGKPIVGKGEYLIEEHPEFADFKPDFANPKANEAASIERRFAGKMTAERWMSNEMTPAEREAFWNENASGMEGSFSLVNPATGSRISAEGVKLLGRIDIDPRADETAIYHENLHGLVRFCRETGVLNEEDAATFVAAFGERRPGADELFNEEAAADAARSFVVKRRNGSAIEDTPANRALAKLFSFGMRIAAEGDIRWAEQKAAEKAMKAVTDQMEVTAANRKAAETQKNEKPVSDNANGGSDNANGAEATSAITDEDFTKPTRDVSLPAMPAAVGDLIGANGRPVIIKKNIFEKNRDSHPELTPEESRRILGLALYNPTLVGQTQPQKRPHYWVSVKTGEDDNATVVVDVYPSKDNVEIVGWRKINDKGLEKLKRQAEREDGQLLMLSPETGSAAALSALPSGTSQGSISKPAEEVKPAAKPATWEAAVPKSPYRVKGHYLVLKLKDVVSSDDPAYAVHKDWQNRIGENKLAEASLQQIKDSFYWKAYGDSAFTDTGAPIVLFAEDAEGKLRPFVVSGNGRMMVLKSLLKDHMYDRYRGGLKEMAAEMGLEVPEDGEEYVLVRAIDDLGGVSIDEFVTKSNGDNKRKVGDAARAKQDAATIVANGLAALYRSNVDGTPDMTPGVNDEFFRLFSQRATDGDAIYDENFNVVEEGKNRVMRALLYVSCGQGDRGPETVDKVILMTDTLGIRRQRNAMECCAAAVAALEANPDYAIGADVSRAMADYMDFVEKKRAGKVGTFEDYLGEQDMFSRRSEIADGVLRLLGSGKNAREIADVVKAYCDIATKSDRDGGLQGAEAARTREDVWREAVAAVETNAVRHSFAALGPDALEVAGVGTPKIAVDLLASTRWSVGNSYADGKLSDLELIDIYRKGDPDALAELYRRYDAPTTEDGKTGGVVGLIARKYPTISDEEKEDLHQEVWVRIINDLDGDVDFSKFSWSTYIFNALRWAAANYYRDENKKPLATLDAPIGDEANGTIESLRTTADSVWVADGERSRKREVLRQLFEILPPDQAAVMNRIADGKTAKEIAKELGLHEYDVKNIKARVIAALKKKATAPADAPQTGVAVSAGMRHVVPIERTEAPVPHVPRVLTSSWRAVASDRLHSASDAAQYSGKEGEKSKENLKDPLRVSLGRLKLTPTEMQVVELTESGLSTKEIAERLGKSASTVLVHLSNARAKGWEAPVKEKNIFSTRELQVLDLRDKGLTSSEIAKETGLSVASVGVHLSNASKKGWEPSEEGQSIRAKKAGITIMGLSKREGEVWALHEKGMRGVDIAKQLGISSATVDVHLSNARKKMAFKAKNVERRLSVAPKGAQKGAAVAYPDASDELRAMSDAAESPRWSVGISPERQKDAEAAVESLKNTRTATSVTDAGTVLRENGAVNRPLTNKILGITARITGNSLSKMMSEKATKKSRSPYLHALAVANADRIFECAFCDATHPDTHGRKEVEKVHRLGSMLHDPKSGMFEPVLVTVIEYKRDGDNVYTLEVVDVDAYEKSDSAGQLVAFADGKRQTPIAEYVGIIAQRVRDFNRAEAIKRVGKVYNAVSQIGKASCRGGESMSEEGKTGNGRGGKSEGRRNDP